MDKRTIELSLEKAKRWYNRGGEFKEIALEAYTEKELTYVEPFKTGEFPKTWKEFCEHVNVTSEEYIVDYSSDIEQKVTGDVPEKRDYWDDRNLLPSYNDAKSHMALMQLHQLRDYYRQGWKPTVDKVSFGINRKVDGTLHLDRNMYRSLFLSFQTKEIAEQFLNNFRELIEQAGDLI